MTPARHGEQQSDEKPGKLKGKAKGSEDKPHQFCKFA